MDTTRQDAILHFWFGDGDTDASRLKEQAKWWTKDPELDRDIRERFLEDLEAATRGEREAWRRSPVGSLAYIVLLDQFSRNVFRDDPRAWAQDPLALRATLEGLERGQDRELSLVQRWFFVMPLMHSEDRAIQRRSLQEWQRLVHEAQAATEPVKGAIEGGLHFARRHKEIIDRFGRYPHRNEVLGRETTKAEAAFLQEPNSSF